MFDLHNISQIERGAGRFDDAERHTREALVLVERFAGMKHPHRASVLASLALIKRSKKEFAEGEKYQREAIELLTELDLGNSPDAGIAFLNLASLLRDQDKLPEAVDAGREAVRIVDGVPGQLEAAGKQRGAGLPGTRPHDRGSPHLTLLRASKPSTRLQLSIN
jgi:tetratricopeptide (TPR) repeat protein